MSVGGGVQGKLGPGLAYLSLGHAPLVIRVFIPFSLEDPSHLPLELKSLS